MKRNLLFILLLCGSLHHPKAQTGNNNYVRTRSYRCYDRNKRPFGIQQYHLLPILR